MYPLSVENHTSCVTFFWTWCLLSIYSPTRFCAFFKSTVTMWRLKKKEKEKKKKKKVVEEKERAKQCCQLMFLTHFRRTSMVGEFRNWGRERERGGEREIERALWVRGEGGGRERGRNRWHPQLSLGPSFIRSFKNQSYQNWFRVVHLLWIST